MPAEGSGILERSGPESGAPPTRAAILVLHGIGEQSPYQTLDAFTRGLAGRIGIEAESVQHRITWRGDWALSSVRMPLPEAVGRSGATILDLYEFYWAGYVQGRIRLRHVLAWIAKTSLTPLRSWSTQPKVLFREQGARGRRLWVFLRELFRSALLLVAAAALVLPFVYSAANAATVAASGRALWEVVASIRQPVLFVVWIALVFIAFMLARGLFQLMLLRRRYRTALDHQVPLEAASARWWRRASIVALVLLAAGAWLLATQASLGIGQLVERLWLAVRPWPVLLPLLAAAFGFVLRRPLIKFVGDITLYVTADQRSDFFRTRADILSRSTELLRWLLRDAGYDHVYVAGHSLGSVIAYDTLNRLVREVRAESDESDKLTQIHLDRLRGLLTFGSPLDKVYYFFRTRVRDTEAIRAQLLSSLHGFRKQPSGREYGDLEVAPYTIPEPRDFRWHNIYSVTDPVSGHLDFYRVDDQVPLKYRNPLTAHVAYWNDPRFYDAVLRWL